MPWTRRQVRFLESSGSPLTGAQKSKMNAELHANPAMGHKKKGKAYTGESHSFDSNRPKRQVVSRYK